MTLARAWTRQLYGAWGVALLAPVTMIAALVVLALGGGFGGLGALAQLVSGPAVPAGSTVGSTVAGGSAKHRTAPLVLPVVPTAPAAAPAATRVAATGPAPAVRPSGGGTPARGGSGQRVSSGGGHGAPPPTATPPPTPTPTPGPTPTPTPAPSPVAPLPALVNGVVAVGVSVTSKLPGALGTLGTGILQSLGQTLDQILTPPPS
ncbi:MAG TPA: hypothetical protein VG275_01030 [Solirubrobacteraceae bacterium]|jgi:hypothetical protein|nr:hypothetical protein [Solirubrobacteraceae bacterium]